MDMLTLEEHRKIRVDLAELEAMHKKAGKG